MPLGWNGQLSSPFWPIGAGLDELFAQAGIKPEGEAKEDLAGALGKASWKIGGFGTVTVVVGKVGTDPQERPLFQVDNGRGRAFVDPSSREIYTNDLVSVSYEIPPPSTDARQAVREASPVSLGAPSVSAGARQFDAVIEQMGVTGEAAEHLRAELAKASDSIGGRAQAAPVLAQVKTVDGWEVQLLVEVRNRSGQSFVGLDSTPYSNDRVSLDPVGIERAIKGTGVLSNERLRAALDKARHRLPLGNNQVTAVLGQVGGSGQKRLLLRLQSDRGQAFVGLNGEPYPEGRVSLDDGEIDRTIWRAGIKDARPMQEAILGANSEVGGPQAPNVRVIDDLVYRSPDGREEWKAVLEVSGPDGKHRYVGPDRKSYTNFQACLRANGLTTNYADWDAAPLTVSMRAAAPFPRREWHAAPTIRSGRPPVRIDASDSELDIFLKGWDVQDGDLGEVRKVIREAPAGTTVMAVTLPVVPSNAVRGPDGSAPLAQNWRLFRVERPGGERSFLTLKGAEGSEWDTALRQAGFKPLGELDLER
jgi:hypothetical protein